MRVWWLLLALGCGKELNPEFCAAHPDDSRCIAADAKHDGAGGKFDIAHLSPAVEDMLTSTSDVRILSMTMIDTSTGTISPGASGAFVLSTIGQENGPDVMVMQAASFTLDAHITVRGDKPLIIVATNDISVTMAIDASANMMMPGAGGGQQTSGMGVGGNGMAGSSNSDAGGGGGGFGTAGGAGGAVDNREGGLAGVSYGDATMLVGGSGGGRGAGPGSCLPSAGAGGGAIQLSAGGTLTIDGSINVGGGGGSGGPGCGSTVNDGAAAGGGGSGGMIFVQARTFNGAGMLGANGGGGGGAASAGGTSMGMPGENASLTGGGTGGAGGVNGGAGGTGASTGDGENGGDNVNANENGGGGGGGAGRIFYKGPQPGYTANPPATSA